MPATHRPPDRDQAPSGAGMAAAGIGATLLVIICCAGPTLLAAGAFAGVGGVLGNPWVIAAGALLLMAAVITVIRHRINRDTGPDTSGDVNRDACCPPPESPQNPAAWDRPHVPADQEGPRAQ